jgi:hypothetical protein
MTDNSQRGLADTIFESRAAAETDTTDALNWRKLDVRLRLRTCAA